jgi:hypothetical protein
MGKVSRKDTGNCFGNEYEERVQVQFSRKGTGTVSRKSTTAKGSGKGRS